MTPEERNAVIEEIAKHVYADKSFTRACVYFARKIRALKTPTP